jgi:[NiFe] hydrogenase assembly HybE family chaperone
MPMSVPGEPSAPLPQAAEGPRKRASVRIHGENPARLFEAAFRRIEAQRMAGLPLLNCALRVEAVGFDRWQGHWLGVLITPWFMNLVLAPGMAESWQSVAPGARLFRRFPAGDFAFLGTHEDEVGEFQTCSLFSPMDRFASQDEARAVALAALVALQTEAVGAAPPARHAFEDPRRAALERPMGKREFLGRMFRRG